MYFDKVLFVLDGMRVNYSITAKTKRFLGVRGIYQKKKGVFYKTVKKGSFSHLTDIAG